MDKRPDIGEVVVLDVSRHCAMHLVTTVIVPSSNLAFSAT